jgi:hypothetical protein
MSQGSDYLSHRQWVDEWVGGTNQTPRGERIFVGSSSPHEYAVIILYRKGINLREIIDQTRFKNAKLLVHVMRQNKSEDELFQNITPALNQSENEFFKKIPPLDTTDFEVKKGDMIWLTDLTPAFLI